MIRVRPHVDVPLRRAVSAPCPLPGQSLPHGPSSPHGPPPSPAVERQVQVWKDESDEELFSIMDSQRQIEEAWRQLESEYMTETPSTGGLGARRSLVSVFDGVHS